MIAAQQPQSYDDNVREYGSNNGPYVSTTTAAGSSRRNRTIRRSSMHLVPLLLLLLLQIISVPTVAFLNTPRAFSFARMVVVVQSSRRLNDDMTANLNSKYNNNNTSSVDVELEQQINQGLQRAREVLQKSKAKLAAMQQNTADAEMKDSIINNNNDAVPFFATRRAATTTPAVANMAGGGVATATPTTTAVAISDTTSTTTTTATNTINDSHLKVKSRNSATGLVMADGERMAEISEDEPWEYRSIYELFPSSDTTTNNNPAASRVEIQTDVMASIQNLRKVLQTEDYRRIFDPRNRFIGEDN